MNESSKTPEHQAVYEKLRERLVLGRFEPGEPLTIHKLTAVLEAGTTPVREAIRRLTAENALEALENRRIIVPVLTQSKLADIYFLRDQIEGELCKRAAKRIQKNDIPEIRSIDAEIDQAIQKGDIEAYIERNKAFHYKIYQHADAPVLMHVVDSLWAQVGPNMRVICGRYGTANLPDLHAELISALETQDGDAAAAALKADLEQGLMLASGSMNG